MADEGSARVGPLPGRTRFITALALVTALAMANGGLAGSAAGTGAGGVGLLDVIVFTERGVESAVASLVQRLGGDVGQHYESLGGFTAEVPEGAVDLLRGTHGVRAVESDGSISLQSTSDPSYDATAHYGSLWWLGEITGAHDLWDRGFTGQGVDVAMIDSGIVPVPGLEDPNHVLHGPDVSLESVHEELRYLDTYGHGTHLAGIIAARDASGIDSNDPNRVQGLAPNARLISIKAAEQRGVADVSQVIAAIDWVITNRNRNGLNIRVLNLSFSTDSVQGYLLDPLSYAVEQAWRKGIVVVTAAGNQGNTSSGLPVPASNPFVVAVGATDTHDNAVASDDTVATFSSRGTVSRAPDVLAPGTRIVSLRSPGSYLDESHPTARIGESMFRGSGTSQSAAVVSGLVALLIQQHPNYTPDQILHLLNSTADALPNTPARLQGNGVVDARGAANKPKLGLSLLYSQLGVPATGLGTLDGARGTFELVDEGVPLAGERDIFGTSFDIVQWAANSALGLAFSTDGWWNGNRWSGERWDGNRWAYEEWTGNRWSGNRWSDDEWAGNRWSGNRWSGLGWTGNRWSNEEWSGNRWSTASWD